LVHYLDKKAAEKSSGDSRWSDTKPGEAAAKPPEASQARGEASREKENSLRHYRVFLFIHTAGQPSDRRAWRAEREGNRPQETRQQEA
jgi:hypothetical protein